jgi:hypothetical protein
MNITGHNIVWVSGYNHDPISSIQISELKLMKSDCFSTSRSQISFMDVAIFEHCILIFGFVDVAKFTTMTTLSLIIS